MSAAPRKTVASIEAAYEQLVTVYGNSRIDMDIEGRSLTKTDGIDRRNKAIALLNQRMPSVQISYTLPTSRSGLEPSGLLVLQNAVANGVRIDFVNPMVFDYYDRATTPPMGQSAINALNGLHSQLATLLPAKTSAQLWAIEGATIMNGLDDYPKKTERLPRQHGGEQLLRHCPEHLGFQPSPDAVHAIDPG